MRREDYLTYSRVKMPKDKWARTKCTRCEIFPFLTWMNIRLAFFERSKLGLHQCQERRPGRRPSAPNRVSYGRIFIYKQCHASRPIHRPRNSIRICSTNCPCSQNSVIERVTDAPEGNEPKVSSRHTPRRLSMKNDLGLDFHSG